MLDKNPHPYISLRNPIPLQKGQKAKVAEKRVLGFVNVLTIMGSAIEERKFNEFFDGIKISYENSHKNLSMEGNIFFKGRSLNNYKACLLVMLYFNLIHL